MAPGHDAALAAARSGRPPHRRTLPPRPAQVLNYGQAIFEGMKAQRSAKGRVVLFRPDKNAERFAAGAARMSMPAVPQDMFVEAVKSVVAVGGAGCGR
jgi:branched-subunit amino acid aminotransferase/4-amino-4-deoxychorismate lyase